MSEQSEVEQGSGASVGFRPLREFIDEFEAEMRAEKGFVRFWWDKLRAIVMVRWRLRLHYWLHPESLRHVSQEAFDIVAAGERPPTQTKGSNRDE